MSKTKLSFPAKIKAQCHGANNDAMAIVAGVLGKVKGGGSIKVITRKGEKKNKNGWSFYDDINKCQVLAHTTGGPVHHVVTLATDPSDATKGWLPAALCHEFVHCHVERSTGVIGGHDPRFRGKVWGWH